MKFMVKIVETRRYNIEVEAPDKDTAEDMALNSEKFRLDLADDTDAGVRLVYKIEEVWHEVQVYHQGQRNRERDRRRTDLRGGSLDRGLF